MTRAKRGPGSANGQDDSPVPRSVRRGRLTANLMASQPEGVYAASCAFGTGCRAAASRWRVKPGEGAIILGTGGGWVGAGVADGVALGTGVEILDW